jgi:hypothetical protein
VIISWVHFRPDLAALCAETVIIANYVAASGIGGPTTRRP